jgi:hypothetical protein
MSIVIGIGYKARNGKDTVTQTIIDTFKDKYDVRRFAFADSLKREVAQTAGACGGFPQLLEWLNREVMPLPKWVVVDPNPDMTDPMCPTGKHRTILQWWGTEYRRNADPYYWVKQMEKTIKIDNPQFAIISDMRFKNEFYWVKSFKNDGWTIKVTRTNFEDQNVKADHPSEIDLDGVEFDINIDCLDGDLPDLKRSAVAAFESILNEYKVNEDALDFSVADLTKDGALTVKEISNGK